MHDAALVALKPIVGNFIDEILVYEVLSETEWGSHSQVFNPTIYQDIELVAKYKLRAMKAYKSEIKKFPHPRSIQAIEALAVKRGSESGMHCAEAFMPVRIIRNK